MSSYDLTIITPTTGKESLDFLIDSIEKQSKSISIQHLLLWDDVRDNNAQIVKDIQRPNYITNSIYIRGNSVEGIAKGSALRSIGLMAARGDWVTFADDDIVWEQNHIEEFTKIQGEQFNNQWGFCKRRIWHRNENGEYVFLGFDNFESVGEEAKTPYKMVDNNCMFFKRRLGTSAAVLYRETREYNDDRLMYAFLMQYGGLPFKTNSATINQVCPSILKEFFETNCSKTEQP